MPVMVREASPGLTRMVRRLLAVVSIVVGLTCRAHAHPHMFFDATAHFLIDDQRRLVGIRVAYLIDELNTTFTIAEVTGRQITDERAKSRKAEPSDLTPDAVRAVEANVLDGFAEYGFFAELVDGSMPVALLPPSRVAVELQGGKLGLVMTLTLTEPLPLAGRALDLRLYDPTYFTEIAIVAAPRLVGSIEGCAVRVYRAADTPQSGRLRGLLAQLSREETVTEKNVGILFADRTRLDCGELNTDRR